MLLKQNKTKQILKLKKNQMISLNIFWSHLI